MPNPQVDRTRKTTPEGALVRLFTARKTSVLIAALSALTVLGSLGADAKSTARPTGPTVVHRDGQQVSGKAPQVLTYSIGDLAL